MSRGRGRGRGQGSQTSVLAQFLGQKSVASPEAMASVLGGFRDKVGGDVATGWIQVNFLGADGRETELGWLPLTVSDPSADIRAQWGAVYGTGPYILRPATANRSVIPDVYYLLSLSQEESVMAAIMQPQAPVSAEVQEVENEIRKVAAETKLAEAKKKKDKIEAGEEQPQTPPWRRGAPPAAPPGYPPPYGYPGIPGVSPFWPGLRSLTTDDDEKVAEELNKTRRDVQLLEDTIKDMMKKMEVKEADSKRDAETRELREQIRALTQQITVQQTSKPNEEIMALIRGLEAKIAAGSGDSTNALVIKALLDNKSTDKITELITSTTGRNAEQRESDLRERMAAQSETHKLMLELATKRQPEFESIAGFMNMASGMMSQSLESQLAFLGAAKKLGDPENQGRPWTEIVATAFKDFTGQRESTERIKLQLIAKAIEKGRSPEEIRQILGEVPTEPAPQKQQVIEPNKQKQIPASGTTAPAQPKPEAPLMLTSAIRKYRDVVQVIMPIIAESIREGEEPGETLDLALGMISTAEGANGDKVTLVLHLLARTPYKVVLPLVIEFCDDEDRDTLKSPKAVEWWRGLREHIKQMMSGEEKPSEPASPGPATEDHGPTESTPVQDDAPAAQSSGKAPVVIDAEPVLQANEDASGADGD